MAQKMDEGMLLIPLDVVKEREFLEKKGFMCGLEIHRRMRGKKLFCSCSAEAMDQEGKEIGRVIRFMRIGEGEEGKVDRAALEEVGKHKVYEYVVYDDGVCLVDLDEEPPHEVNKEALEYGLKTSLLLNCKLPEEVLFMRKVVVDGSNTTGFQRTALIGLDGYIESDNGKVGIQTVCLEEESAQIVEAKEGRVVYDLRRLGIPLIEIATSPDIKDGEHCKQVAKQLGDMLKYTFFYQRGLGTIRQDINISIKDGARVEIKGVQDVDMIPLIVAKEVQRQLSWIEFSRRFKQEQYSAGELKDVSKYFNNSKSKLFSRGKVFMFPLRNAKGMFSLKLTDTRTVGNEIASRLRAKTPLRGMVHTDEDMSKYGVREEVDNIINNEGLSKDDLLVFFITDSHELALKGREVVVESFFLLFQKPQEETRKVNEKGDSEYLRPLPGAARMYPETDVPPIPLDIDISEYKKQINTKDKIIKQIYSFLSFESDEERRESIKEELMNSKYLELFLNIMPSISKEQRREFVMLVLNKFKEWEREYNIDMLKHPYNTLNYIINLYFSHKISKEAIPLIISELSYKGNKEEVDKIINKKNLQLIKGKELDKKIKEAVKIMLSQMKGEDKKKIRGKVLSQIREQFKYCAEPKEVVESTNKALKDMNI